MSADISVFSRRGHQKNFRTSAQSKLVAEDDTFDLRLHATAQLIHDINLMYTQSISVLHMDLAEKVLKYRLWSDQMNSMPLLVIPSGLSEADRLHVIQHLIDLFRQHNLQRHASISCVGLVHTDDILNAIVASLQQLSRQQSTLKRSARRDITQQGSAIDKIQSLLDILGDTPDRLYVIIQDAEVLSPQLLSEFVEYCDASLSVVIVLIQNSAVPLPLPLHANINARVACDMLTTATPSRLMDVCSGLLVLDEYFSSLLSPELLCHLYALFDSYERCVYTFIQRLHLYVSSHFEHRSALLSMFRHIPYLLDRKITPTKGALSGIYSRAVAQLMWYMGPSDLLPCQDFLSLRDSRTAQADVLLQRLYTVHAAHKLRLIALDWLRTIRNKVFAHQERNSFPVLLLWEICSCDYVLPKGDYHTALSPFFDVLRLSLKSVTLSALQQQISAWNCVFSPSFDIEVNKDVLNLLGKLKSRYEVFSLQLAAILQMMQYYGVDSATSYNALCTRDLSTITSLSSCPYDVMKLDDFKLSSLVEEFLDALYDFVVQAIYSLLSQPPPSFIPSITTLTSESMKRVMEHSNADIRRRTTSSLCEDAKDDITLLHSILRSRDKIDILTHELLEDFISSCSQWMETTEAKHHKVKRKRVEPEAEEEVVYGRCRFLMALNELQKMGYIRVTSTGNFVKKLVTS